MSNAAIAKRLGVSKRTVQRDIKAIGGGASSSAKPIDRNASDPLLGVIIGRGGAQQITAKSLRRNIPFDSFMGIDYADLLLSNNPRGLANAFSIAPWAYRCIKVLSNTGGSIPLKVVVGEDDAQPNHPLSIVFGGNRSRLIRDTISDRAIFGVAYWLPIEKGARKWIRRLNPLTIKVIGGKNGIQAFKQYINGELVNEFDPNQLIFIPEYNPENDLGYVPSSPAETDVDAFISPMMLCLRALNVDLAAWEFVRVFFENDATPSYILTTDQIMQKVDMERIIDQWQDKLQGVENAHRPNMVHGGLKIQQLTSPLKDLVIPELDERTIRRICAVFGVPLTMALATDAANYATAEIQRKMFYTETILPELDMILDEVNMQFVKLIDKDARVVADTDNVEVLQEDQTEITDRASKGYISGYRTFNEARELDGLEPVKHDFVLMNGQAVLVSDIKEGKLPKAPEQQPSFGGFNFGGNGFGAGTRSISTGGSLDLDRRRLGLPSTLSAKSELLSLPEPVKQIVEVVVKSAHESNDPENAIEDAVKSLVTKDLNKWQTKSTRVGTTAPFKSDYIPSALASFIKMDLRALHPKDGAIEDQIKTLFDRYKDAIKQDNEDLATPEEFEQYWLGVDDSFDDIIAVFEKHWAGLSEKVAKAIRADGANADLQSIIDANTDALIDDLVGTENEPAPLTQLFLAGAARGNDLYDSRKSVKADTALSIDWKFVNQEAADWARNHAATMVRGINQTTLQSYQDAIANWIENVEGDDGSMGNLAAAIEGTLTQLNIPKGWSPAKVAWATSPERAALIAQTESTNAFSKGVTERWKQVGVQKVRWRTQNDSRVCELCRRLNNLEGNIDSGVYDSVTGKYYKPSAHVGCRCFEAPVVN